MSSSFQRRGGKKATSLTPSSSSSSSVQPSPRVVHSSSTSVSSSSAAAAVAPSPYQRTLSSSILPGTRPWTSNLTLTSFGLREIDSFLFSPGGGGGNDSGGGGQPLQTLVLIEEDRLTDDLSRALCRYWCAEGVAQRQLVMLPSLLPSAEKSLQFIDGDLNDDGDLVNINNEGSSPEELHDFVLSLPRNLHLDKLRLKATAKNTKQSSAGVDNSTMMLSNHRREAISAIAEEDDEHDEDDDGDIDDNEHFHENQAPTTTTSDEGLINAWQYRTSIQVARSGIDKQSGSETAGLSAGDGIYCHSYNLSQRMWDQFTPNDALDNETHDNPLISNTRIIDCSGSLILSKTSREDKSVQNQHQGMALFCTLWKHLQSELSSHRNRVIRLFIHRLPVGQGSIAMSLLMAKIRKDNLPVVVLATIRPWRWLTDNSSNNRSSSKIDTLLSLRNTADTAISVDSFSSLRTPPPPEFSLLQGILTVQCASSTTSYYTDTVTNKRPLADRFGIKRDGRKVTVQLLHLPPEDYSKGGSSTGGGDRSGGGNITATSTVSADGSNRRQQHHHEHDVMSTTATGIGCSSSLEF